MVNHAEGEDVGVLCDDGDVVGDVGEDGDAEAWRRCWSFM